MVKAFLGRGHNLVDTAFMYADGKAETLIGGMNLPKTGISEAPIFVITAKTGVHKVNVYCKLQLIKTIYLLQLGTMGNKYLPKTPWKNTF